MPYSVTAAAASGEETKVAAPLEDIELGKLPTSSSSLSLSGSVSGAQAQAGGANINGNGGKYLGSGPRSLRWDIKKLSVPVKKKAMTSLKGNFELLGPVQQQQQDSEGKGGKARIERNILYNVVGHAEKGQMLALMGASGAGKSSLLDCISLRNHRFEGHVYLDTKPVDQHFFSTTG